MDPIKDGGSSKRRNYMAQILAVCIKNILLVTFGMTLGYPTILIPGMKEFDADVNLISWIGSINLICVPIGGAISGLITQTFGRKRTMQMVNVPFFCAWLLFGFSQNTTHVLIALCTTGLTGGLLEAPVITYVAEICQPKLRGALSSTSSLSVILGVLIEFLFGLIFTWKHAALANCFFPVLSFALLFFVPESPHWLMSKNRHEEAKRSIAWLRGWTDVKNIESEYEELKENIEKEHKKTSFVDKFKLFFQKNFVWPFSVVAMAFFLGHFSGMSTLTTFAVQIFASVKAPINKYLATVILGVAEVTGCILCVVLIHKLGKRVLSFVSLIGTSICFVVVATYVYLIGVKDLQSPPISTSNSTIPFDESNDFYNSTPLIFLILAALLSHTGIRILPWILTGELYSTETRAAGSGFSSAIAYIFGFLANKSFLYIVDGITLAGTFWLNAIIGLIGCLLIHVCLPETEGKTLHEISEHFRGGKKLSNLVRKKNEREKQTRIEDKGVENKGFSFDEKNSCEGVAVSHL